MKKFELLLFMMIYLMKKDVSGDSKMLFCFKVSCESQEQDVTIVKPLENHSKLIDFSVLNSPAKGQ